MKTTIGFIGAGRICKIFLEAWHNSILSGIEVILFDTESGKALALANTYQNVRAADSIDELTQTCSTLFLAIHPPAFQSVMPLLKSSDSKPEFIISLSPKITVKQLQEGTGVNQIMRSIPNAPSIIGKGYNVYSISPNFLPKFLEKASSLFLPLGQFVMVEESLLESYATITGMGPTYLWFLFNHLQLLAEKFGIPKQDARNAVNAMIVGASETLLDSNLDKNDVFDLIPSFPLKPRENEITGIYTDVIDSLYNKMKI